jgi:uncharacterized delta-60 repeat protein
VGALATGLGLIACGSALAFFNTDPTFDGDGVVRTDGPGEAADEITDLTVLPDGKILAAARLTTADSRDFSLIRYDTDGSLDETFGGGDGIVTTNLGGAASRDNSWDLEIQEDGKIVVAGYTIPNDPTADLDVAVARYTAAGALDDTFDGESGMANGAFVIPVSATLDDSVTGVTIDGDGNIVLAGEVVVTSTEEVFEVDSLAIRLTPTGAFDDSFDDDGIVTIDIDDEDGMNVARILDDGDVLVGGYAFNQTSSQTDWAFAKLNSADGSLDEDFDGDLGPGNGVVTLSDTSGAVAGIAISSGAFAAAGGPGWTLARFNQDDGTLDTGFGTDGAVTTTFPDASSAGVEDLIRDGTFYVASGYATYGALGDEHFAVARYFAGGGADTENLGPNGVFSENVVRRTAAKGVGGFEDAQAVAVVDDANAGTPNKIVAGGTAWFGAEVVSTDAVLVRLGPDEVAPETAITKPKQGRTTRRRVTLRFAADEPATFRCRLDSKPFVEDCESGRSFRVSLGRHVFTVEATDPTGNVEDPPATRRIRRVPRR